MKQWDGIEIKTKILYTKKTGKSSNTAGIACVLKFKYIKATNSYKITFIWDLDVQKSKMEKYFYAKDWNNYFLSIV